MEATVEKMQECQMFDKYASRGDPKEVSAKKGP